MRNFVSELQRRNVLRVVAAYGLVAWIIIEAGSVLLPTFGATTGTFQIYVVIVVLGFILSLLAWVFEITSDGVQLDQNVERTEEQTQKSGRIMNFAIIGLLIIALIVSMTFNVADLQDNVSIRNAIAVLPFENRSTDPDNVLFADGIHDDLLTKLANTGALRVISRTSVLEYRNTTKNLRQIGEELRVDTLLEGSVQKVGDNVRINVQLIDAQSDEHLWAQTYDRKLTMQNIFSIQSEISDAISGALRTTLMPGEQTAAVNIPTDDIQAYRLYVSGRDNLYLRRLETLQGARRQFEQAIELDPDYAEAYVGLAESLLLLHINHVAVPRDEALRLAQDNLDIALTLNPDLADAYATLGLLKTHVWSETRTGVENLEAEAAFERAISLNHNHAQAYMWFASLRSEEQRFEDAIAFYHRSLQLDPLGRIPSSNLPQLYARLGQNDLALKLWLDAIKVHPEWPTPYQNVAEHLWGLGRLDEAIAWNRTAQNLSTDPALGGDVDIGAYLQFGDRDKVYELLDAVPMGLPITPVVNGLKSLSDGKYDEALELFSNVIDTDDSIQPFIFDLAADIALVTGDLSKARDYALRQQPLLNSANPVIDRFTVDEVVRLAYIDRQNGDSVRADELLNASLGVVQKLPRLGMFGHGILDVQIYALLDRREDAFAALNQAIDEGFRSSIFNNTWLLDNDPYLASIRSDPRFAEILGKLEVLNAVMYRRVIEAEASGNWDQLTSLISGTRTRNR